MKVGDLVKYKNLHGHVVGGKFISKSWRGLVVELGSYDVNKDLLILWNHGSAETESSASLEVISESR